jgi:pimeloyl-ACP methyl ester carboxylesterase
VEQERRVLLGPGGRRIVFHVAGPEQGDLLVYHTGTPGTSRLYVSMIRECAARGLRIACPARPGYGGSDRVPGRSYADNPVDTAAVADSLGAETFYVFGHSGGGGPALADAALIGDRVRAVAVSATHGPRPEMGPSWRDGLDTANRDELKAIEAGEAALREFLEVRTDALRQVRTGDQITTDSDFSRLYAPVDRECFHGEFLEFVVESFPELTDYGVDGWLDDDVAFFGDWCFDLARIAVPVSIWAGGQDRVVPVAHAEWLADHVPGARLHLKPEEGHISLLNNRFGAVVDELIELG